MVLTWYKINFVLRNPLGKVLAPTIARFRILSLKNNMQDMKMTSKSSELFRSKKWQEFQEENPWIDIDLMKRTEFVEEEMYLFIRVILCYSSTTDRVDFEFEIQKMFFQESLYNNMQNQTCYCFHTDSDGNTEYACESELLDETILVYKYTEDYVRK